MNHKQRKPRRRRCPECDCIPCRCGFGDHPEDNYREDVYEHMSPRDLEWNDRMDLANEIAKTDPDRAAEIRMGA